MRKLATDFAFAMRMIGSFDKSYICVDSYSWRKDFDMGIPQTGVAITGYKANRVKDDEDPVICWESFKEVNNDFIQLLEKYGNANIRVSGAEADDLMFLVSKELFAMGEDCIIVTLDSDISQLVKFNDKNFICCFNTKSTSRQVVGAPGFEEWLVERMQQHTDVDPIAAMLNSDLSQGSVETVHALIQQTNLIEVDPEAVVFNKVVCGDMGDNIPAIATWETTQKSGKVVNSRITESKAATIKEMILDKGNGIEIHDLERYAKIFVRGLKQIYNRDFPEEILQERLSRNTFLVLLSEYTIPQSIVTKFHEVYNIEKYGTKPSQESLSMQALLEGTKYYEDRGTFSIDIFKDADDSDIPETKILTKKKLF